jgi:hypothetical protein
LVNPNELKMMKLESLLFEVPLSMHDKAVATLTMNNWAKATHAVLTSEYQMCIV